MRGYLLRSFIGGSRLRWWIRWWGSGQETSDIGVEPRLRRNNDLYRLSGFKQLLDSLPPPCSLPFSAPRVRHPSTIAMDVDGSAREPNIGRRKVEGS